MASNIDIKSYNCIFSDISPSIQTGVKPGEIARILLKRAVEVLKAKGAVIRTLNLETNQLDLAVSYGMSDKYLSKGPVSWEKVIKELVNKKEPRIIVDLFENPRIQYPKALWEEGIRMVADAPLLMWERTIGMIRIYFTEKKEMSCEENNFLMFTSRQGACAISEAGLLEEQRIQYDRLALETEKMSALGRMAAGIAHEINNPLASILLYGSSLIKEVPDKDPLKEGLEVIINETKRCKAIIQDLLEFSRVKEPSKALANINTIIEKALSLLNNELRIRHIRVEKHLSNAMVEILVDERQLMQVFVNILLNALQAIGEGGMIAIRSRADMAQNLIRIEFTDSGPGISEENLSKIFDPFFSTKKNGTGLGLSVSYRTIKNHNGDIRVSSKPGEGTRFTIDLPFEKGSRPGKKEDA
ncbi:MAG: ATP-binding protein [Desulfobacteraceae bacterium]